MSENFSLNFEISDPQLISINDQYMHPVRKTKSGRYHSYFAPTEALKRMQSFYKEVLQELITDEDIEKLKLTLSAPRTGLSLDIIFGMPENDLTKYDASNYIKALEDCIVNRTGIDDSMHHQVRVTKSIYPSNAWIMKVYMSTYEVMDYGEIIYLNNGPSTT